MAPKPRPIEDRFWEKVQKEGHPNGCWIWTACVNSKGYPQINRGGRRGIHIGGNILSWQIANGPIPGGLFVLHKCDNPLCVNPEHLFLGTQKQNMEDKVRKGRQARGETNGNSRMTEDAVRRIKELFAAGWKQNRIAKEVGATDTIVSMVVTGKTWRHV